MRQSSIEKLRAERDEAVALADLLAKALVDKAPKATVKDAIVAAFDPYRGRSQDLGGSALELASETRKDRAASAALIVGNKDVKKSRQTAAEARKARRDDAEHDHRQKPTEKRLARLRKERDERERKALGK